MRSFWRLVGRVPSILGLLAWTAWAVVHSSALVARDIIAPSSRLAPTVVAVGLRCQNRWEIAALTGVITITPGTLVVGIEADQSSMLVHGMYGSDPVAFRASIEDVQNRVLGALRPNTDARGRSR